MSTHTSTVSSPVAGASSRRQDEFFSWPYFSFKIVRLEKVLVQLSECLTEKINNLTDEEQLWVRMWIRSRETNLTVSLSDHLIVFCISKYTQKTKTVTVKTRHVSAVTLSTLSYAFSGVVEILVLRKVRLVGSGGRLVGK